jgi:acyl-CoA thioesterase FadM
LSQFTSFVRIPLLALRHRLSPLPRIGLLEIDHVRLRVLPIDIDFNLHLNNARYLNAMDYGRMRLLARSGLFDLFLRSRWKAIVGAVWMTYRRSLPLFARYELATRLVCWDERWFYMEQTFTRGEELCAVGWVRGALLDQDRIVSPRQIIASLAPDLISPPLPENILAWNDLTREKLGQARERTSEPHANTTQEPR